MREHYDWKHEIAAAMSNSGTWFTSHLLRLIAKADRVNREILRSAYPEHVAAFERWQNSEGEFSDNHENLPSSIWVEGRRWFDRVNGNTYHTTRTHVEWKGGREERYITPFQYGYDDQYLQSAYEELISREILPKLTFKIGIDYGLRRTCEELGITFHASVTDVARNYLHDKTEPGD